MTGAWSHSPQDKKIAEEEFTRAAVEQVRWFDYWLKGIDNGIMKEPPIRYQIMKAANWERMEDGGSLADSRRKRHKVLFSGRTVGKCQIG